MKKKKISELGIVNGLMDTDNIFMKSVAGPVQIQISKLVSTIKNKGYYSQSAYTSDLDSTITPMEVIVYNAPNSPVTGSGYLIVRVFNGGTYSRVLQEYYNDIGTARYYRVKLGTGAWSAWKQ